MSDRFVLATANPGKIKEMGEILAQYGITVLSRGDLGINVEIEETGTTFLENAIIKAQAICILSGLPAIGDDSGLSVDALGGEPGIYSSTFGGEALDDMGRCLHLLNKMEGIEARGAKFVCAVACVFPDCSIVTSIGECYGEIVLQPQGSGGFGYDPVFKPSGMVTTIGELTQEEKNKISHRGKALAQLAAELGKMY